MANEEPSLARDLLFFEERNPKGGETIIFLHGGYTSHLEWEPVIAEPCLAPYHLLLADLPRHSGSRAIGPFALGTAADEIAKVIRAHGHNGGKAHVVGFSLGGFTGLELTARHPDLLLSCFVTGAMPFVGTFKFFAARPRLLWTMEQAQSFIPGLGKLAEKLQGIKTDDRIAAEAKKNHTWELTRDSFTSLSHDFDKETFRKVGSSGVRTCAIAGGKMDQVESLREMGPVLREAGAVKGVKNTVVVVREAYHPWHMQFPGLFAKGVEAWITGQQLSVEFEEL